ncbi:MAG TPA: hypothetical protein VFJ16_12335 [Longimicrobium sp.]|nr:hypothetical protein [Longimicrobium sp.]
MSTPAPSGYPTVDFSGDCGEASGSTPHSAQSSGMQPFQEATINGGPPSNCIVGNDAATVYGITLTKTAGIYTYRITVDGQGPSGLFGGFFHLAFTDQSGDTYYLSLYSSTREQHTVDYNSDQPNIVKIWWSDNSFNVPGANAAKAKFRVTSPAAE